MVAYCFGIISLTKLLKAEFTEITHPWYADNYGALGMFSNVDLYFNSLKLFDP